MCAGSAAAAQNAYMAAAAGQGQVAAKCGECAAAGVGGVGGSLKPHSTYWNWYVQTSLIQIGFETKYGGCSTGTGDLMSYYYSLFVNTPCNNRTTNPCGNPLVQCFPATDATLDPVPGSHFNGLCFTADPSTNNGC